MKTDYSKILAEEQYSKIKRKIICERNLCKNGEGIDDYKIYCFNGTAKYILVCVDRNVKATKFYFFDRNWNFCPITRDGKKCIKNLEMNKPANFEKMIDYADVLSKGFPFVRVDFYNINGNIVFGEMTFTPSACLDTGRLPETDLLFGNELRLPKII